MIFDWKPCVLQDSPTFLMIVSSEPCVLPGFPAFSRSGGELWFDCHNDTAAGNSHMMR